MVPHSPTPSNDPLPFPGAGDNSTNEQPRLTDADMLALDALIDAGLDLSRVDPSLRDRASHVARVLGLLDVSASAYSPDELLVDVTIARVVQLRRAESLMLAQAPALSDNDQDAVEELVAAGFDVQGVSGVMRPRAQRAADLLALLHAPSSALAEIAAAREQLVQRTLGSVQTSIDIRQSRMAIDPPSGDGWRITRWRDVASVAALLLIGTAVIGPMVSGMRAMGQRMSCQAGLGSVASAFGLYAGDSRDSLPMASASLPGTPWWNVGKAQESNSANLYTLSRTGYAKLVQLACPSNAPSIACASKSDARASMDWSCIDEVSYSFQNLFTPPAQRPGWGTTQVRIAVLIDRSPVVPQARNGFRINPLSNSPNHAYRGQNALFNDGSATWLRSPVLAQSSGSGSSTAGDNVWLPRQLEDLIARRSQPMGDADPLKGTESPESRDDTFVGP
jgi:hypothetical protein